MREPLIVTVTTKKSDDRSGCQFYINLDPDDTL